MTCEDLVAQCFLDEQAPLAVPELNRERTLKYLQCCYQQGMSWEDAKQQIQAFLQQRGCPPSGDCAAAAARQAVAPAVV